MSTPLNLKGSSALLGNVLLLALRAIVYHCFWWQYCWYLLYNCLTSRYPFKLTVNVFVTIFNSYQNATKKVMHVHCSSFAFVQLMNFFILIAEDFALCQCMAARFFCFLLVSCLCNSEVFANSPFFISAEVAGETR